MDIDNTTIVYINEREISIRLYGLGEKKVQLITYIIKRKNNWLKRLFGCGQYKYIIHQNDPEIKRAYYDTEVSSNDYINSIKTYEYSIALKWIIQNKHKL